MSVNKFSENGGQGQNGWSEPPTTPIGKDELALKRHRYFTELLDAAQAAIDQRVCSNPMGPMIADILSPTTQHASSTNSKFSKLLIFIFKALLCMLSQI